MSRRRPRRDCAGRAPPADNCRQLLTIDFSNRANQNWSMEEKLGAARHSAAIDA